VTAKKEMTMRGQSLEEAKQNLLNRISFQRKENDDENKFSKYFSTTCPSLSQEKVID